MKILHYALGFPPYRTGGLTKYCTDLMLMQKEKGHYVGLLWPGQMTFLGKKICIRKHSDWKGIQNFELVNPLPVALDEGITNIDAYTAKCVNPEIYKSFILEYKPDIIHIHTLMGLHQEAVDIMINLGVRTVFTTHDYYGICPKVTLYHNGFACVDDHDCEECISCNKSALSLRKITFLQSPLYRTMKNSWIIKKLRKEHRKTFFEEQEECLSGMDDKNKGIQYKALRSYYCSMLEKIDIIHFNSTLAERIYRKYMTPKNCKVISITHRDIADHRTIKNFDHDILKLAYLGPAKPFKGFQYLISVLDELWTETNGKFELHLYSVTNIERPYISHMQDGYLYSQLEEIFENTDLLVVPSQWYETYGFTVLEALSYGVPALVTERVGAKDLVSDKFITSNNELKNTIKACVMNRKLLVEENKRIQFANLPISGKEELIY